VRRRPYCVVLFDEIEKAHPDVFNTLLQVLDDGRITDSQGRTVDFRNTIVIMTSNIGAQHLLTEARNSDGAIPEDVKDLVLAELRGRFRPEFLNRVDDIIVFAPLGLTQIESIVDLSMGDLARRLAERQIRLEVTPEARRLIAERGYDPLYGARPLRRYISHDIETRLGRALLSGSVQDGSTVRIDVRDGDIAVDVARAESGAEADAPV
jgi:ATP-dependent Clp protease ATP-binding subunit ClpB